MNPCAIPGISLVRTACGRDGAAHLTHIINLGDASCGSGPDHIWVALRDGRSPISFCVSPAFDPITLELVSFTTASGVEDHNLASYWHISASRTNFVCICALCGHRSKSYLCGSQQGWGGGDLHCFFLQSLKQRAKRLNVIGSDAGDPNVESWPPACDPNVIVCRPAWRPKWWSGRSRFAFSPNLMYVSKYFVGVAVARPHACDQAYPGGARSRAQILRDGKAPDSRRPATGLLLTAYYYHNHYIDIRRPGCRTPHSSSAARGEQASRETPAAPPAVRTENTAILVRHAGRRICQQQQQWPTVAAERRRATGQRSVPIRWLPPGTCSRPRGVRSTTGCSSTRLQPNWVPLTLAELKQLSDVVHRGSDSTAAGDRTCPAVCQHQFCAACLWMHAGASRCCPLCRRHLLSGAALTTVEEEDASDSDSVASDEAHNNNNDDDDMVVPSLQVDDDRGAAGGGRVPAARASAPLARRRLTARTAPLWSWLRGVIDDGMGGDDDDEDDDD
ncbi:hypothetical protein niasHS_004111 [Heterodera schachtii]|uniref:RING-type domain-containing protein n=1 Tax=Heterodera schachtii TaxID=97005 RepID=A0ABD2JUM7_HETSC